eukprot:scaffold10819_cov130-Amphora_coffeaeformis.AAC.2
MLGEGKKASNIIVYCSDKVELHQDVTFLPCPTCYNGFLDLVNVLINFQRYHDIESVMVEGGPTLLGKFMEAQLLDAACVTIAPVDVATVQAFQYSLVFLLVDAVNFNCQSQTKFCEHHIQQTHHANIYSFDWEAFASSSMHSLT